VNTLRTPPVDTISKVKDSTIMCVYRLGSIGFFEAYQLQTRLVLLLSDSEITNCLLLLEHPPTITIGKFGKVENILIPRHS